MAFYTQELKRAKDPSSGRLDVGVWVVWSEADAVFEHGPYQVAYCPRQEDAERIADMLNSRDPLDAEKAEAANWAAWEDAAEARDERDAIANGPVIGVDQRQW